MPSRREELRIDVTASDNASGTLDSVADKVEGIQTTATVEVEASDEATEVIEGVGEEVDALDGATAEPTLEADDEASDVVDDVSTAVDELDGATASTSLEAEDNATADIDEVESAISDLDGQTATVTIESEGADSAAESTGSMADSLGDIAGGIGGQGLAALSAAGMLAIGQRAGEAVLQVQGLAQATGGSLDQTSRLKEAWDLAGGTIDSLERNIIRANDRLRESPELASALGIHIGENTSAMDVFIGAVNALNSGQLTANQRLELATEIFGSKGVIILDDLQTRVGNLSDGMAAVSDNEIITQEDVENALELQGAWDTVEDTIGAIEREILPAVAVVAQQVADILATWPIDKLIGGFELLGTNISLIEAAISGALGGGDGGGLSGMMEEARLKAEAAGVAFQDVLDLWNEAGDITLDEALQQIIDKQGGVADATDDSTESVEDQIAAMQDQQAALAASRDALLDLIDTKRSQTDATYKARDAQRDFRDKVAKANDVLSDQESSADDQAAAIDDVALAAADAADAQVDLLGDTASATEKIDAQNGSLLESALTMAPGGPLQGAIVDYVASLNGIPDDVTSEIKAAIARGDIDEAERLLENASRTRDASIQARIDESARLTAEAQLNYLSRGRYASVYATAVGGARHTNRATGGRVYAGRGYTVGEHGPEPFFPDQNGTVVNNGQYGEMMRNGHGGGGVVNNYTTLNVPAGTTARDVRRQMLRGQRTQGAL